LTTKRLDPLATAMRAVANQSVDVSLGVPKVGALGVGTSEPFGVDADGGLRAGFSPHARVVQAEALALHTPGQGGHGNRPGNRVGCVA
jgi:hypothetical protein